MKSEIRKTKTPPRSKYGQIHHPGAMFVRLYVCEAKTNNGKRSYSLSTFVGGGLPIVESKQTGKWFTLSWTNIINLAVAAGIDKK